jgi:competence protein ComEA
MFKIVLMLLIGSVMVFAINLQKASKSELMQIKGIGEKKAESIIKYRKTHKIKSASDLKSLKGFGDKLINNIKHDVKNSTKKKQKKSTKKKIQKKTSKKNK